MADGSLAYAKGTPTVAEGDIVEAEGFRYEVAASGASDCHLSTAGGVKLYAVAGETGRLNVRAFNAKGDGTTDNTGIIQAAIDYCTDNGFRLRAPGGPYLVSTIDVTCPIHGDRVDSFGNDPTFVSAVGAGIFAVRMRAGGGEMHDVTVKNTEWGTASIAGPS